MFFLDYDQIIGRNDSEYGVHLTHMKSTRAVHMREDPNCLKYIVNQTVPEHCYVDVEEIDVNGMNTLKVFCILAQGAENDLKEWNQNFKWNNLISGETTLVLQPRYSDVGSRTLCEHLYRMDCMNTCMNTTPLFLQLHNEMKQINNRTLTDATEIGTNQMQQDAKVPLTESQNNIFHQVLQRHVQVVWGPPGSGKTYFSAATIVRLMMLKQAKNEPFRVVVTACTKLAIHNLLLKLVDVQRKAGALSLFQVGSMDVDCPNTEPGLKRIRKMKKEHRNTFLDSPRIVVGTTCYTAGGGILLPKHGTFDLLLVDEGSQLRQNEFAVATSLLNVSNDSPWRIVVVGDHFQMPPIVKNKYPENIDQGKTPGCHLSVLDFLRFNHIENNTSCLSLKENHRMNEELCRFTRDVLEYNEYNICHLGNCSCRTQRTSHTFSSTGTTSSGNHSNSLSKKALKAVTDPPIASVELLVPGMNHLIPMLHNNRLLTAPLITNEQGQREFDLDRTDGYRSIAKQTIHTSSSVVCVEMIPSKSMSTSSCGTTSSSFVGNEEAAQSEANLVAAMVLEYESRHGDNKRKPFIVTPHHYQRIAVCRALGIDPETATHVNTVEKMQGQETDLVIACYGFSNPHVVANEFTFVYDRHRLNVAASRAREKFVLIVSNVVLKGEVKELMEDEQACEGIALFRKIKKYSCDQNSWMTCQAEEAIGMVGRGGGGGGGAGVFVHTPQRMPRFRNNSSARKKKKLLKANTQPNRSKPKFKTTTMRSSSMGETKTSSGTEGRGSSLEQRLHARKHGVRRQLIPSAPSTSKSSSTDEITGITGMMANITVTNGSNSSITNNDNKCQATLKSGKKAGQRCTFRAKNGNFCGVHQGKQ